MDSGGLSMRLESQYIQGAFLCDWNPNTFRGPFYATGIPNGFRGLFYATGIPNAFRGLFYATGIPNVFRKPFYGLQLEFCMFRRCRSHFKYVNLLTTPTILTELV
jgi:hypothetical protein